MSPPGTITIDPWNVTHRPGSLISGCRFSLKRSKRQLSAISLNQDRTHRHQRRETAGPEGAFRGQDALDPGSTPPGQREAAKGSYQPSAISLNQIQLIDVSADIRATLKVAPTNATTAQRGQDALDPRGQPLAAYTQFYAPVLSGIPLTRQVARKGLFRVNPSSANTRRVLKSSQGTDACVYPLGDSRKSSPAASERRRSFWPFFFGEKEKGQGNWGR